MERKVIFFEFYGILCFLLVLVAYKWTNLFYFHFFWRLFFGGGCVILFCFLQSDGTGITARELVQHIFSGDYEKEIESHGVALQEMENAFFSNQSDRRNFLRILERVVERLSDVESNGYSPPKNRERTTSMAESENSEPQTQTQDREDTETAATSRSRKKKKKKNKKAQQQEQQQQQEVPTEASKYSEPKMSSKQSSIEPVESKEEDPLVTALLGMGFTEEQIMAAAKACGGTHRATADDMVSWILGQDSHEADDPPLEETVVELKSEPDVEVNDSILSNSNSEDVVQDERAEKEKERAAQRLAAKREEQRRKNREWNNREQVRQQEEAKAKLAQVMAPPRAPPSVIQGLAPAYPKSLEHGLESGLPSGVPNGLHSGFTPTGMNVATQRTVGRQHAKSLTTPSVTTGAQVIGMPSQNLAPAAKKTVSDRSGEPSLIGGTPFPMPFQSTFPASSVPTYLAPSNSPLLHGLPLIGDDDRTVSSFGSNPSRSLSVSSNVPSVSSSHAAPPSSAPPPGFRPPSAVSASVKPPPVPPVYQGKFYPSQDVHPAPSFPVSPNHHGEIRATAKVFVPANFVPTPTPAIGSNVPTVSAGPPFFGMHPQQSVAMGSAYPNIPHSSSVDDSHVGFLLGGGLPPLGQPSLLSSGLQNSYDRVPSVTPLSEDSPAAPSAESSVTAVPSIEESLPLTGVLGLKDGGVGSNLLDAIATGQAIGGSSIWGDAQSIAPLTGLPSFSFGLSSRETSVTGEGDEGKASIPGWGGLGGSSVNSAGRQGSIW